MQLRCQIILQIWGKAKLTKLSFHFVPLFLFGMGWVGVVRMAQSQDEDAHVQTVVQL